MLDDNLEKWMDRKGRQKANRILRVFSTVEQHGRQALFDLNHGDVVIFQDYTIQSIGWGTWLYILVQKEYSSQTGWLIFGMDTNVIKTYFDDCGSAYDDNQTATTEIVTEDSDNDL